MLAVDNVIPTYSAHCFVHPNAQNYWEHNNVIVINYMYVINSDVENIDNSNR